LESEDFLKINASTLQPAFFNNGSEEFLVTVLLIMNWLLKVNKNFIQALFCLYESFQQREPTPSSLLFKRLGLKLPNFWQSLRPGYY
jgi:hypothetical protein